MTESGIIASVKLEQFAKHHMPSDVTEFGIATDAKLEHWLKQ